MTQQTIDFEIGSGVLGRYKNLNYTPWYAIAEFVDNSLHSYKNNKDKIDTALSDKERPQVKIGYDSEKKTLRIIDNFMGMDLDDLKKSMRMGVKADAADFQLSEFGMGMKTASFWLGNKLIINTTKLGNNKRYRLKVSLIDLVQGNLKLVPEISDATIDEHGTTIFVEELTRQIHGRSQTKVVETLASMYREFIRTKEVDLIWKSNKLKWHSEELRTTNVEGAELKTEIKFEINGKSVSGWAGIMKTGKTSRAGFDVIRNGRLIMGYPSSNWKPDAIFGTGGGMVTQRLIGELRMDEFEVTHTKDNIDWDESGVNEADFVDELKESVQQLKSIAAKPKKNTGSPPADSVLEDAKEILESDAYSQVIEDFDLIPDTEAIQKNNSDLVKDVVANSEPKITHTATLSNGTDAYTIKVYTENVNAYAPYLAIDLSADKKCINVVINSDHTYYNSLESDVTMLEFIKHCIYDAISEFKCSSSGDLIDPSKFRAIKNSLLQLDFAIQQES